MAAGRISRPIDHATLDFVKEFGLLLFVFTMGLQLGPGFFSSLRRDGVRLNILALLIVAAGSASFQNTAKSLTVTNTPGTIINWQGFSIGAGEQITGNPDASRRRTRGTHCRFRTLRPAGPASVPPVVRHSGGSHRRSGPCSL